MLFWSRRGQPPTRSIWPCGDLAAALRHPCGKFVAPPRCFQTREMKSCSSLNTMKIWISCYSLTAMNFEISCCALNTMKFQFSSCSVNTMKFWISSCHVSTMTFWISSCSVSAMNFWISCCGGVAHYAVSSGATRKTLSPFHATSEHPATQQHGCGTRKYTATQQ